MVEERFRLIYLSKDGTGIKQVSLTRNKLGLFLICLTVLFGSIVAFALGAFTKLYQNYQIVNLKNDKEYLQSELMAQKERVTMLSTQLGEIETISDELRTAANLEPIDSDVRQFGVGGPEYSSAFGLDYYSDNASRTAVENGLDLDRIERVILYEKMSLAEIKAKFDDQEEWLNHFPSIRPVLAAGIISHFGYRIDPFTNKNAFHYGTDYLAMKGTTVLATADGVVKRVVNIYKPNISYGKYIVIDHGNGYETLYAHLSEIDVTQGQTVKRWDPIGRSGNTGRAEGYHLHYEVHLNGVEVDPANYDLTEYNLTKISY